MRTVDTQFLKRLRKGDDSAWFELWEVFGPALERMVERFARRCFSPETVRDVSQETLMRLAREIHRFDPSRGTRFSTWLFQISKHVVCGEFAYRNAKKRGSGIRPGAMDPAREPAGDGVAPPIEYERAVFRAKVYRAMRLAEQRLDFLPFEVYKARILRGMVGKDIAPAMGISEATVSRYLRKARRTVQDTIREVVAEYSFTNDEVGEIAVARLDRDDDEFDSALADIYATEEESRKGYDTISRAVVMLEAGAMSGFYAIRGLMIGWLEILMILALVFVIVRLVKASRPRIQQRPRTNPPPAPRTPPSGPPRAPRPPVSVGQMILALIFCWVLLPVWALASIGDFVAIPLFLTMALVTSTISLFSSLIGATPPRLWRFSGRQYVRAGRAGLSILYRLMSTFGLGGLVDRMKEDIRATARGPSTPPPRPLPTRMSFPFEDQYRIESQLGAGGSTARLFVVRRIDGRAAVGDRLVLKYFDMGLGSRLEEAIRESRGMQVAKEMGIVLDHRLAEDHFYYVMPYYAGETLTRAAARTHRHLGAGDTVPRDDLRLFLGWMAELLRTLDGYHRHGVIHKDVKPDNLIVTDEGIRLVDLGLLTPLTSALTLTTHGTEYFRDPEMVKLAVQGKRVRDVHAVRFDIYSAGAVLYFLLEGSFPACGPLSRFSRPVPLALSWIVSRAMAEGDKRYPRVTSMRADLEEIVRLMEKEDPDRIAVSNLPSFRGFDEDDLDLPLPPSPSPVEVLQPVASARSVRPMPRPRSPAGPILAVFLICMMAVGIFALAYGVSGVAPQAEPGPDAGLEPAAIGLDSTSIVDKLEKWREEISTLMGPIPSGAPPRKVLLLSESALGDELHGKLLNALLRRGWETGYSETTKAQLEKILIPGTPSSEIMGRFNEIWPDEAAPFVLKFHDTGGREIVRLQLYYLSAKRMCYADASSARLLAEEGHR